MYKIFNAKQFFISKTNLFFVRILNNTQKANSLFKVLSKLTSLPKMNFNENTQNKFHRIRQKFNPDEDELLQKLVAQYGTNSWDIVASKMKGRNIRQVRERWSHYLCSKTAKRPWTPEEDALLLQKVQEFGTKWTKIITFFTDRTDIQAKTRWLRLTNRRTIHEFLNSEKSTVPVTNQTETHQSNEESSCSFKLDDDKNLSTSKKILTESIYEGINLSYPFESTDQLNEYDVELESYNIYKEGEQFDVNMPYYMSN